MLRCTTPSERSSELSILERQKAMLQRLCFNKQEFLPQQANMPLFQYQNMMNSSKLHQSLADISPNLGFACSGISVAAAASVEMEQNHHRSFSTVSANSSRHHRVAAPARKRKAEVFDTEVESNNKMLEGEVESSCVTVKIEKGNYKSLELAPKTDYIHVRARRGQATDNHSLAERARREKITKKMKCLQELVPGCNKVIGKAGMLDEIINYVQSLQKQVEFLSMKLAALNPRTDFNMDNFFTKEKLSAYIASFPSAAMSTQMELMNSSYLQFNQGSAMDLSLDTPPPPAAATTQLITQKGLTSSLLPCPETYLDSFSNLLQVQQISESDWQSIYNLSFHLNQDLLM